MKPKITIQLTPEQLALFTLIIGKSCNAHYATKSDTSNLYNYLYNQLGVTNSDVARAGSVLEGEEDIIRFHKETDLRVEKLLSNSRFAPPKPIFDFSDKKLPTRCIAFLYPSSKTGKPTLRLLKIENEDLAHYSGYEIDPVSLTSKWVYKSFLKSKATDVVRQ